MTLFVLERDLNDFNYEQALLPSENPAHEVQVSLEGEGYVQGFHNHNRNLFRFGIGLRLGL